MQIEQPQPLSVPWTTRDVWLGVIALVLWLVTSVVVSVVVDLLSLNVDVGFMVSLAEFLLLVPVWWLAVRKYKAGWNTLGLRRLQCRSGYFDFRQGLWRWRNANYGDYCQTPSMDGRVTGEPMDSGIPHFRWKSIGLLCSHCGDQVYA